MVKDILEEIECIAAEDGTGKGLGSLAIYGDMERAARSLLEGGTIFITTGCYINDKGVVTNGPAGAVALAVALNRLGKDAVLVTDGPNKPLLKCALDTVGLDIPIVLFPMIGREAFVRELLEKYRPSHVVALERIGPARDGRYYDIQGKDVSPKVAHLGLLFTGAAELGITTIGIGDRGNEIGMGKVYDEVVQNIPHGECIACTVSTDYLVVGNVSNWAAHGICACLSLLTRENLMMGEQLEKELLKALAKCGTGDTRALKGEPVEVSLKADEYFQVINRLREIAQGGRA